MPHLKDTTHPLTRLLQKYGYTSGAKLERVLTITAPTAIKRLHDPELLTVEDLHRLNRFGHIPIDEIRQSI
jgi:hypothetical protein